MSNKNKSIFRILHIRTRKSRKSATLENGIPSCPTVQQITQKVSEVDIVTVTPCTTEISISNRSTVPSQHETQLNSPRAPTILPKGACALLSLHDSVRTGSAPTEGQFPIDFVAVHGLNGNAETSWTAENGFCWLRDALPVDFPGCRVYSFGYPADVFFTKEKSTIPDFARALLEDLKGVRTKKENQRRPLVFLCHSMGGIIVKKAFNISVVENARFGDIRSAVPAIAFFGTPHHGSNYADYLYNLSRVINVSAMGSGPISGKPVRIKLLKSLSTDSEILSSTAQDFRLHTNRVNIYSFTEQTAVPGLKEKVVNEMSSRMNTSTEVEIPMLGCDHKTLIRYFGRDDYNYQKVLTKLQEIANEATTKYIADLTEEDESCLHSLSFQAMTSRQQETNLQTSNPHPNSCHWITDDPSYHSWSNSFATSSQSLIPTNLLWIKGHPGTGKSTIMSFLAQHLAQAITDLPPTYPPSTPILLTFFFHGNGSLLQKSLLGMFRSLLHQLYKQCFTSRTAILAFFQRKAEDSGECGIDWEWQVPELRELLTSLLLAPSVHGQEGRDMVILIDALDESIANNGTKAAKEILAYVHNLAQHSTREGKRKIKFCVSSRHYPVITPLSQTTLTIKMEESNSRDIEGYISHILATSVETWSAESPAEKSALEDALAKKANGVFLWAKLRVAKVVKGLNDGIYSVRDVMEMVEGESSELSDLYKGVLREDVDTGNRDTAVKLLAWVCLAERPLTVGELRYAMGCERLMDLEEKSGSTIQEKDYEESKPFVDSDVRMERMVKSLSGGLAEVRYYSKEGTVQLFHQSVNDFLRANGLAFLRDFHLTKQPRTGANLIGVFEDQIAKSCLRYLRCGEIFERIKVWTEGIQKTYIFIEYAARYWAIHAKRAEERGITQEYLLQHFSTFADIFEGWKSIYYALDWRDMRCPSKTASLLHVATLFDLQTTMECALRNGASVHDQDQYTGATALVLAAKLGHHTSLKRLIELGADVNGPLDLITSPLELAALNSQVKTVKILIQHGAELNKTSDAGHALGRAAAKGNLTLCKILLEGGASMNLVAPFYGSALQVAAFEGHQEVVKLLIWNGADVNVEGGRFGCALQGAIKGQKDLRLPIVKYLLDKGADVNLGGGQYGNPLQAAVSSGDMAIVKLLLSKGADMNATGGEYGTTMQAAAYGHNLELAQFLLDQGADINVQGGEYGTALQGAIANGNEEIAKLLIDRGADVNAQGGKFGNALQAAANSSSDMLVPLLISRGAKIVNNCGYFGNVLQAAVSCGNEETARLFVSMGVDINESGSFHGDVLQAAVLNCKESFARYLLEQGANVNAEEGECGSPLRAAIQWCSVSKVRLYLEWGADPNGQRAGYIGSPLHAAALKGKVEIVRILLDRGARLEDKNYAGVTALHCAISGCHKDVVELLLSRGAQLDVSAEERRALSKLLGID